MAKYMLLLREDPTSFGCASSENEAILHKMVRWTEDLAGKDKLYGVSPLTAGPSATIHAEKDLLRTVDGPYTEGKEVVIGYFIIEADNIDQATKLATSCPKLENGGCIEVREVGEFPVKV